MVGRSILLCLHELEQRHEIFHREIARDAKESIVIAV